MKIARILMLFVVFSLLSPSSFAATSPFDVVWDSEPIKLAAGSSLKLNVTIRAPEGYYLYADETELDFVSLEGMRISKINYPKALKHEDPYLGKSVNIYKGDIIITVEGYVPVTLKKGSHDLVANLRFRGCSPTLCFRPEEKEISFEIDVLPTAGSAPQPEKAEMRASENAGAVETGFGIKNLLRAEDFGVIIEQGFLAALIIVFFAGILTSLTPCVWPVIPVVLLFVGVHPHKKFWENLLLSATLIAGLILVYSILGLLAVFFGKNLGFLFQEPIFLALVVLFFIAMSLSMFGVFDLRIPRSLHHKLHQLGGKGYRGAFLAGMGTGLVASPCAGPVLAALLGYVALQRNFGLGFIFLVVYGFGMGLLIVIIGACYGELAGKLKGGPWMLWIRRSLGIILLFPAAFYMGSLFNWSSMDRMEESHGTQIEWVMDETKALQLAAEKNKPVMIEFGADWCPPCRALEERFFKTDKIIELGRSLVPLRIDATRENKEVRRVIEKYNVIGWPSVIFLAPDGKQYEELRVNSYDPERVEKGMNEAVDKAKSGQP